MATAGRPRAFDREAALHEAMLVFWRKGFLATSMNDLCDAMGIRSPSLYAAFGSKESLYAEALQRYNASADRMIWDHISDGATAKDGVRSVLKAAADVLPEGKGSPSGCMVHLYAIGEGGPEPVAEVVKDARLAGLKVFRSGIRRAIKAGELPASTNVERLSRFFLGVVQGMAIQARDGATRADLAGTAEIAMAAWPAP